MVGEHCAADPVVSLDGRTVHVIATSPAGTREALEAATALARGLGGRVVVFVRRAAPDVQSIGRLPIPTPRKRHRAGSLIPTSLVHTCCHAYVSRPTASCNCASGPDWSSSVAKPARGGRLPSNVWRGL